LSREVQTVKGIVEAGIVFLCQFSGTQYTCLANTPPGCVNNSKQVYIIIVVGGDPEIRKNIPNFLALKKTHATGNLVWNILRKESFLKDIELVVCPYQDSKIAIAALFCKAQFFYRGGNEGRLGIFVLRIGEFNRLALLIT
jgi:hypothetical protein